MLYEGITIVQFKTTLKNGLIVLTFIGTMALECREHPCVLLCADLSYCTSCIYIVYIIMSLVSYVYIA